ncbi:MAG TPA: sigma-70 family RNA polymerase sigma factor [Candidatus Limnocylindrales bacterium]|jgi:RNA polymerase sigma-70 factor (ECF subfamily)
MSEPVARATGRVNSAADDADREVLEAIAAGDHGAIAVLYERYKTMAYGLAMRITGDASLADDVVQEAFVGAWRNAGRYATERGSVKTWLLAIVHHRAIDAVRRRRPTSELPEHEEAPPPSLTLPDVWSEVAGRLDREEILGALATLSVVQREALELGYFSGLTQQEIAVRTNTPLGTVKSRMRLGLLQMRRAMLGSPTDGGEPA